MADEGFVKVANIDDIPPGSKKAVKIPRYEFLLVNVAGTIHACDAICNHQLYPLRGGDLDGEEITCDLHGAVFNVTTGAVVSEPATKALRVFEVRVEGSDIFVGPVKS